MPPEILALLAEIKNLEFERNPLLKLPEGLFLIPTANEATLGHILDTLIHLPVWRNQPCTPYMWHIHLTNRFGWNLRNPKKNCLISAHRLFVGRFPFGTEIE